MEPVDLGSIDDKMTYAQVIEELKNIGMSSVDPVQKKALLTAIKIIVNYVAVAKQSATDPDFGKSG